MVWNYRIIKKENEHIGTSYFEVCECYYGDKDTKIPHSWSASHNLLMSDELEDLKYAYDKIQKAFEKPILELRGNKLFEIESH